MCASLVRGRRLACAAQFGGRYVLDSVPTSLEIDLHFHGKKLKLGGPK
jgi:hypothetical protein